MIKVKTKDKLFNNRNEVIVDEIKDSKGNTIDLEGLINNPVIKDGYYIYDKDNNLKWIETIPEDYMGYYLQLELYDSDTLTLGVYNRGEVASYISLNLGDTSVIAKDGNNIAHLRSSGVDKLDFARLTHSLNELDPTLKSLCETAISSRTGQPCSQEQWNVIKALLDKSLYFYYNDFTMIKIGGIYPLIYSFSCISLNSGCGLEFEFDPDENLLTIYYNEI